MAKTTAKSTHAGVIGKQERKAGGARAAKSAPKWSDRPAGLHIDGEKIATLREVRAPEVPTMSLGELTRAQRVRLVLASLRAKPEDFTVGMIGPGIINKTRAIAEVEAQSRIGRTLTEIELMLLSTLSRAGEQVS